MVLAKLSYSAQKKIITTRVEWGGGDKLLPSLTVEKGGACVCWLKNCNTASYLEYQSGLKTTRATTLYNLAAITYVFLCFFLFARRFF